MVSLCFGGYNFSWSVAEKAFAQAANFSADELAGAIVRLAELDAAAKGGSKLPADLELECALVDTTRRA